MSEIDLEVRAAMESASHHPDEIRGCECGFCVWSVEHVAIMSVRAALAAEPSGPPEPEPTWLTTDCGVCDNERAAKLPFPERLARRMIVCPDCGDKRCPKAAWHGNVCQREPSGPEPTTSDEPIYSKDLKPGETFVFGDGVTARSTGDKPRAASPTTSDDRETREVVDEYVRLHRSMEPPAAASDEPARWGSEPPHTLTEYGTTNCPVEGVRATVDDGECSACGARVGPAASGDKPARCRCSVAPVAIRPASDEPARCLHGNAAAHWMPGGDPAYCPGPAASSTPETTR